MSRKIATPAAAETVATETPVAEVPSVPTKRRVTLNRVKAKFAQANIQVTLVWDRTHFHFEFDGSDSVPQDVNKVNVPRIGDLTEDAWVTEAKRVLEAASK